MNATYNSHNLNANGYEVTKIDLGTPKPKVNKHELVRADGQVVTNINFGEREIVIAGRILASNQKDMEQKLDTLKSYLSGYGNNLDVTVADSTRRFVATVQGFNYEIIGYHCTFEINFTADAFGKDTTTTSLTFGTYTDGNEGYTNTISGSYKAKPTIDFTINQVEPYWTSSYIQVANSALNQVLRLTENWNWFDRVVINGEDKTVSRYASSKTLIDNCDSTTGWTSSHTLSLETTDMKEGTGCLKNVMAGAHDHVDFSRLNSDVVDLSSTMGKVIIPIFIPTPSAGAVASVKFYAGSDATLANNYSLWTITTQWNGSALATNAWNYLVVDLSTGNSDTGTPTRGAIKSIQVSVVGTAGTMQLSGVFLDYLTLQKAGVTATTLDYEGIFPELDLGSSTLTFTDECDSRNITITGNYTRRYL